MGKRWTTHEDELIRKFYPEQGASWDGWKDLLPDRTQTAVGARARYLDVYVEKSKLLRLKWTAAELRKLRQFYPTHGYDWDMWAELLPGRSKRSISMAASRHRILCGREGPTWADYEDEVLKALWPIHGASWDGWEKVIPRHTSEGVSAHASRLGLTKDREASTQQKAVEATERPQEAISKHDGANTREPRKVKRMRLTEGQSKYILLNTIEMARNLGLFPIQVVDEMICLRNEFENAV